MKGIYIVPGVYNVIGVAADRLNTIEIPYPTYGVEIVDTDDDIKNILSTKKVQVFDPENGQLTALIIELNGQPFTNIIIYSCNNCNAIRPKKDMPLCSRCRSVRYCNRQCQCTHWLTHKNECSK